MLPRSRSLAAWVFVAPALIAIGVFFAIPVGAALLMSLTDFDIYALADIGNLPPRRSAWRDERLAGDPHARAFRDQLERARPAPKIPEWERIVNEMQLVAEQVVRGRLDVDQAGRELDRRIDVMLEKRRWMLARGRAS